MMTDRRMMLVLVGEEEEVVVVAVELVLVGMAVEDEDVAVELELVARVEQGAREALQRLQLEGRWGCSVHSVTCAARSGEVVWNRCGIMCGCIMDR